MGLIARLFRREKRPPKVQGIYHWIVNNCEPEEAAQPESPFTKEDFEEIKSLFDLKFDPAVTNKIINKYKTNTMYTHLLDIKFKYYSRILSGVKPFIVTSNDNDIHEGDRIHFMVHTDDANFSGMPYPSRSITPPYQADVSYEVTYVQHSSPEIDLGELLVVGIKPIDV